MSSKFDLYNYMADILINFYEKNDLEHLCALESLIGGNFKTTEQREWLERFCIVWGKIEERSQYNDQDYYSMFFWRYIFNHVLWSIL